MNNNVITLDNLKSNWGGNDIQNLPNSSLGYKNPLAMEPPYLGTLIRLRGAPCNTSKDK